MKKIFWLLAAFVSFSFFAACNSDDDINLNDYKGWKELNDKWLQEMLDLKDADGNPYYTKVSPGWNPSAFILMHYFNDRAQTAENLVPLYTSTVDVRYIGYDCQDVPFDSTSTEKSYGTPGVRRFMVNGVIQGWSIALMDMHVGDTAEVVIPYELGYGTVYNGMILPYSNLRFNIRLEDIYRYEAKN